LWKAAQSGKRLKIPLAEPNGRVASMHVHGNVLSNQRLCGFCLIDEQAHDGCRRLA
jgi:hypothetical protein